MVARGWGLVYGGGKTGMMGAIARAVKQRGGRVVGVIPEFMKVRELAYDEADELVTVITMRERKLLMETRADAFVALPGGWGTLEEILEILTLRQLDVVKKPCVLFNQDGFYEPLLALFQRMLADKFSSGRTWSCSGLRIAFRKFSVTLTPERTRARNRNGLRRREPQLSNGAAPSPRNHE